MGPNHASMVAVTTVVFFFWGGLNHVPESTVWEGAL
jgi:hypothetical protein